VGAEAQPGGGVHFRVWAPRRGKVEVVVDRMDPQPLASESEGYFSGLVPRARAGSLYKYRLDGADEAPDPASRYQPDGPHGPSRVGITAVELMPVADFCGRRGWGYDGVSLFAPTRATTRARCLPGVPEGTVAISTHLDRAGARTGADVELRPDEELVIRLAGPVSPSRTPPA